MKEKWEKHENEEFSWEIEGQEMRLAFGKGEKGNDSCSSILAWKSAGFLSSEGKQQ